MTADNQLRCERECTRLCNDFAWTVDNGDYNGFVALFAIDGIFERAGQVSRGHEAIHKFLDARPAGRVTRHACSNIRIDMTGSDTATGSCMALMFQAPAGQGEPGPLTCAGAVVAEYMDDYILTAAGWKFKHRRATIVFQP